MAKFNAENERIKREYLEYLKGALGLGEQSLDAAAKALHRFEASTKFRDFRRFHIEQAKAFRRHLALTTSRITGKPLSPSTVLQTLNALRAFFIWLADRPGYKSRIRYADAEYFRISEKEARIAKAVRERPIPTPEQIRSVLAAMPSHTDIERRDRAVIAFTFLTGIRDGALASLKLKHVDLVHGKVDQDAREVKTKFAKTFTTWFFPVGEDVRTVFEEWVAFLQRERLWSRDDPLFPASDVINGEDRQFKVAGLSRRHWTTAGPIRRIFREAFASAGLAYFNPHSFRKTLVLLGQRICDTPEKLKAWSQNLGHEDVLTTLRSYGEISPARQAEIIANLSWPNKVDMDADAALKTLERVVKRQLEGGGGGT